MELPVASSAFQIKPDLENILQSDVVKQLIQKVVADTLLSEFEIFRPSRQSSQHISILDKTYSEEEVKKWTKSIADDVNRGLKSESRYKHVVQVVISKKLGQGFKFTGNPLTCICIITFIELYFAGRCRWDSECDRQVTESYVTDSMTCIVSVFSVYLY